jgi:murein DD-endopeptidase MepM/ murein hydrolase activator NlpD
MSRRIPKTYTILISCTGRTPITLSFQPMVVLGVLLMAIAIPTAWIGKIVYSYHQKNIALTERNANLSQQANNILEQVETLETQLQNLQERAGLPEATAVPRNKSEALPQGGIAQTVAPENLLNLSRDKLYILIQALKGEVQPALEQTLEREESRPHGVPLKVAFEQSSGFGFRRNPFGGGFEFHNGLDFTAAYGTPIYATAPGVIVKAESSGGYGNHVVIDHGYGYQTLYAHLSKIEVESGMQIERDRIVGYLGNTGRSSGPHLHYTVYHNGEAVDPKYYLE